MEKKKKKKKENKAAFSEHIDMNLDCQILHVQSQVSQLVAACLFTFKFLYHNSDQPRLCNRQTIQHLLVHPGY